MKIKLLIVLSLAASMWLVGCRSSANTNVNTTMNSNMMTTTTPVVKTSETAATNPAMAGNIEKALKAKGFNDVTVDTSSTPATLRGSYPKDKLAEVMATAMEANGGKPVKNEATGK